MKWSIIQLQKYRERGLEIDETVDVTELTTLDNDIRRISPVHVTGRADIRHDQIVFHVKATGEMIVPCSRTLVDVPYSFEIPLTERFLLKPEEGESYEEEDVHFPEGNVIDFRPILEEAIILEVPMQIFSEEADEHVVHSGKDWAFFEEEEELPEKKKPAVDPRLAGLQNFFSSDDE
ncbi:YceD family protein [Domibacillus robiginosus]|uniref:YceD family protein n=1 Tax=Domibacillus robiginosus TaxID=1071054 RepID=UPI00067BC290|nr:YceD family protein [Domibacillus robiginosus]